MSKHLIVAVAIASLAATSVADVVHLKSGATLEGQVVKTDDGVIVKLPAGEVRISTAAIARIETKPSVLDEFAKRAAGLKDDDLAGLVELAQWAQARGLKTQARDLWRSVLAMNPEHALARQALGYRNVNGKWMTEDEAMKARGLLKHDGEWMTPEAAARLRTLQAELELAREKRRAAEAELERAREDAERVDQRPDMPIVGYNPWDHYYSTRELRRYNSRSYYWGQAYSVPHYTLPYSTWWFYPGGYRSISPYRHHRRHR